MERGSLSTGKTVRLSGPEFGQEVEIVGVEMLSDPRDPSLVRIVCSKPTTLTPPSGPVEGWSIVEE